MKKFRFYFALSSTFLACMVLEFKTRAAGFVNVKMEGGYAGAFRLALK